MTLWLFSARLRPRRRRRAACTLGTGERSARRIAAAVDRLDRPHAGSSAAPMLARRLAGRIGEIAYPGRARAADPCRASGEGAGFAIRVLGPRWATPSLARTAFDEVNAGTRNRGSNARRLGGRTRPPRRVLPDFRALSAEPMVGLEPATGTLPIMPTAVRKHPPASTMHPARGRWSRRAPRDASRAECDGDDLLVDLTRINEGVPAGS